MWTEKDIKHLTSPNLLKMIHHTNKITVWFEKNMLEFPNLEERVAVLNRLMDILTVSMAVSLLIEIIQPFFLMASSRFFCCCLGTPRFWGRGPSSLVPFNNHLIGKCWKFTWRSIVIAVASDQWCYLKGC